jgi:hypothetical protein
MMNGDCQHLKVEVKTEKQFQSLLLASFFVV